MTAPLYLSALGALAALIAAPARAEVTLINVFEAPPGQEERLIEAWEQARAFLSAQPGYVSTALHRAIGPDARFALINIAVWESPESFAAAIDRMRAARAFPQIEGVTPNPALYRVIRTDDPEARRP